MVSDLGAIAELVIDGSTGFRVKYTDTQAWVDRLHWCGEHPTEVAQMGRRARQIYLNRYTPEANYKSLMEVYSRVLY